MRSSAVLGSFSGTFLVLAALCGSAEVLDLAHQPLAQAAIGNSKPHESVLNLFVLGGFDAPSQRSLANFLSQGSGCDALWFDASITSGILEQDTLRLPTLFMGLLSAGCKEVRVVIESAEVLRGESLQLLLRPLQGDPENQIHILGNEFKFPSRVSIMLLFNVADLLTELPNPTLTMAQEALKSRIPASLRYPRLIAHSGF
jgi:hypothetical protein